MTYAKQEYQYSTYVFYNKKGERLSIFYNNREITAIPCSRKDIFRRKIGKLLYTTGVYNRVERVTISKDFSQREFINWCNTQYYRLYTEVIPTKALYVLETQVVTTYTLDSYFHKSIKIKYLK